MIRSSSILGALVACLALAGAVANAQESNPVLRHPANDAAEGRVLVKFRDAGATGRAQAQAATDRVAALATRTGIRFRSSRALGAKWHVVELDPIEQLLIGLQRAGRIDRTLMVRLQARYLRETKRDL